MIVDNYFKTRSEAEREATRHRRASDLGGMITKIAPSPYGGFRVRSIAAELVVDSLTGDLPAVRDRWFGGCLRA